MCRCRDYPDLVDISNRHTEFTSRLLRSAVGDWVLLMSCPECGQQWKVDAWDKYLTCYAVKLPSDENWESFDSESLIKQQMVKNRGGLTEETCIWANCTAPRVNGSAYCIDHLWDTGARA